ncbi:hypothetical protein BT93_G1391 [Corymbia citriodora subsp. variegata]|nr:hypothetical protein BT93_G1391 [Corymbia citriodora subsp. variegata]
MMGFTVHGLITWPDKDSSIDKLSVHTTTFRSEGSCRSEERSCLFFLSLDKTSRTAKTSTISAESACTFKANPSMMTPSEFRHNPAMDPTKESPVHEPSTLYLKNPFSGGLHRVERSSNMVLDLGRPNCCGPSRFAIVFRRTAHLRAASSLSPFAENEQVFQGFRCSITNRA